MNLRPLLIALVAVDVVGFLAGMYFYWPQMLGTNPLLWLFIPDCPLYVLLAALLYLRVLDGGLLRFVTAVGLLKYGLWTLFALLSFSTYYFSTFMGLVLVIEHIGMAAQFFLLVRAQDTKFVLPATVWFLFNDLVDYSLGAHPLLPAGDLNGVMIFSVLSSLAVPLLAWGFAGRIENSRIAKKAREALGV